MDPELLELKNIKFFRRLSSKYDHGFGGRFILEKIKKTVKSAKVKPKSRVLDLGCGTGNLLTILSKNKSLKLHGMDLSESMLKVAISKLKDKVKVKKGSVRSLLELYRTNYFDYIFISDAFHHMPNHRKVVEDVRKLLKRGGKLIISDFNFGTLGNQIFHVIEPGNSGMHTAKDLKELLLKCEFKKTKIEKHGIVSIYVEGTK